MSKAALLTTECVLCTRDKHIPNMYSSANNMDPGPIPLQLQVIIPDKSKCYQFMFQGRDKVTMWYHCCIYSGFDSSGGDVDLASYAYPFTGCLTGGVVTVVV